MYSKPISPIDLASGSMRGMAYRSRDQCTPGIVGGFHSVKTLKFHKCEVCNFNGIFRIGRYLKKYTHASVEACARTYTHKHTRTHTTTTIGSNKTWECILCLAWTKYIKENHTILYTVTRNGR